MSVKICCWLGFYSSILRCKREVMQGNLPVNLLNFAFGNMFLIVVSKVDIIPRVLLSFAFDLYSASQGAIGFLS